MNEVYILIITKEPYEEYADVQINAYQTMEGALRAYSVAVDEAREEANESFGEIQEFDEIVTDSYRYFQIFDNVNYDSITIEVRATELIGDNYEDL